MEDMLEVSGIDVYYGVVQALRNVSFEVGDLECIGFFGPNGHGKSTILKTISGLLQPTNGYIKFNGKRIDGLPPNKIVDMGVVHVPEGQHLFPEMTVQENLMLGAYTRRAWKQRNDNLQNVFEIFPELKEKKNDKCSLLSGGQRQMVAVGRGLMACSKLLMLDETTLGLAPILAKKILERINAIKKSNEISIIIIDENLTNVTMVADKLYLIENGTVSLSGPKEAVLKDKHVKSAYLGNL
jgi:branched-chain amino acid transport system ATP-binding protein